MPVNRFRVYSLLAKINPRTTELFSLDNKKPASAFFAILCIFHVSFTFFGDQNPAYSDLLNGFPLSSFEAENVWTVTQQFNRVMLLSKEKRFLANYDLRI